MAAYWRTELKFQLKALWRRWAKPTGQVLVAFVISIGGMLFWTTSEGQQLDLWVLKRFFVARGVRPVIPPIIIVGIDDESFQNLGLSPRWPLPRKYMAEALEHIVSAHPKAVIVDATIPKEDQDPASDARIEAALRAGPTTIWTGVIPKGKMDLVASDPSVTFSSEQRFRSAAKMELPMLLAESHGEISRIAYNAAPGASLIERIPLARPLVELAHEAVVTPGPFDLINFYGPKATIPRMSLYQLVGPTADKAAQQLQEKIVFVGFQSVARKRGQMDKDEYEVPVSSDPMFGVEIHANIAGNLMDGSALKRLDITSELSAIFLIGLLVAVLGLALTPEKAVPLIALLVIALEGIGYYSFISLHRWLSGLGVLLIIAAVTMMGSALYHYVIIKSFRKYIQKTFKFDFERGM